MLVSQNIVDAFCEQIGHELGASHQYIAIAAYFDHEDLGELAKFFFRQADEERAHAMKFVRFLLDAGARVVLPAVPAPTSDFDSARAAVALSLKWEEEVTQQIYDLVELCQKERNHIALRFLDWFVTEQLEEVSTMSTLLGIVERAGDNLLYVEDYLARHGVDAAAEG
ncbi:MAG: ferritin [Acidobacteria bacterium]|nr:MAG: ferritin [Acidobacteriota bacterium]